MLFAVGERFGAACATDQEQVFVFPLEPNLKARMVSVSFSRVPVEDQELEAALQTAPPNFRTILKNQIKKPDYWPVIGSIPFTDGDRLWIFGQKGGDGVPAKAVDLGTATETNYLLPGIPSEIHGGFAYFQSQEDDVLRLERRKIGPAAR